MNWNYCPNCGQKLQYEELAVMPPIEVISCHRCGWEMREGRAPTWSDSLQKKHECCLEPDFDPDEFIREKHGYADSYGSLKKWQKKRKDWYDRDEEDRND